MGYSKLPNEAVDLITEVSVHAWRLYCYLLRCYNRETGQCNPSAATCAKAINVSLNHIFKSRRELSDAGLVSFDYGVVTFLIGSKDIYGDVPEESNPIHTDRAEDSNPIHTDRGPYPHGYAPLFTQIGDPIHTDNAYKEEPDELIRRINQTNRTRESADAPRAKESTPSKRTSATPKGDPSPANKQPSVKGKRGKVGALASGAPKSKFHNHPSVVVYQDALGFYALKAAQADLIAEVTGTEIERAPPEWLRFLRDLAEIGYKHSHNVRVAVLAFERYRKGVPLSEALRLAWDEAQGRTNSEKGAGMMRK